MIYANVKISKQKLVLRHFTYFLTYVSWNSICNCSKITIIWVYWN
jgi:hypothetical protein